MVLIRQIAALAMLIAIPGFSQIKPACASHFYNKSNFQWSIYNFDGQKTWMKVLPNSTAIVPWGKPTAITISGAIPNRPYLKNFNMQTINGCMTILQDGDSGDVVLNQPSSGDIATCTGNC